MRPVLLRLMDSIAVGNVGEQLEHELSAAFVLLPGIVAEARLQRRGKIKDLLDRFTAKAPAELPVRDLALDVIAVAQEWLPATLSRRQLLREAASARPPPSEASVRRRLESFVRERRLSSAMATLEHLQDVLDAHDAGQEPPVRDQLCAEEAMQLIAGLNPAADEDDTFTVVQEAEIAAAEPLKISADVVKFVLKKLPVGSAAGASPWTYSAIQAIFYDDDHGAATSAAIIARFCDRMLASRLVSPIWLRSRAVLIPKDGSAGWRPLGIGEAWYRFVGRCAMQTAGASVGEKLLPMQLGCGIPGGCEIAGRMGQVILDSRKRTVVLLALDQKNAFNLMRRRLMLRGILRYERRLAKWFKWSYGRSSPLYLSDGQLGGMNSTGCRQGDPLSSLCFCVGMQFVLDDIQSLVRTAHADLADTEAAECGVYAYMDDTNVYAHHTAVNAVIAGLKDIFVRHRLVLNMDKCRLLGRAARRVVDPLFDREDGGLKIMGAPTGKRAYRRAATQEIVEAVQRFIPTLRRGLELWSAWSLLKHCITARLNYVARVVEPELSAPAFKRFDAAVDEAVFAMAGSDVQLLSELDKIKHHAAFAVHAAMPEWLRAASVRRLGGRAGVPAFPFDDVRVPGALPAVAHAAPGVRLAAGSTRSK